MTIDRKDIEFTHALKRHLLDPIDILCYGIPAFIAVNFSLRHQRLGDMWAQTIVIDTSDPEQQRVREKLTLDWQFRRDSREEIIELVKADKLKPNVTHNNIICTLDNWNIPPISNGGNEIAIYKTEDNKLTVEFFINRGFLDSYSAFVYTNDKEKIQKLEESTTLDKGLYGNKKLDENWYRVSY